VVLVAIGELTRAIETEGLTKVYPPSTKAVDGITCSVDEGEIFGFLGPNGAGKTTTIRMLTTLASVTEGRCTVAGYDVRTRQDSVRMNIGLVPQDAAADGDLTGMENLLLSAKLYKVPDRTAHERADQLFDLVGLTEAARRLARTYSGGMKKRLELIAGLIHEPKILFLDEPTLGLDIQTRTAMWSYIRRINKERGTTIFLTTHYLEEADSLCGRVAIIDHGQVKAMGPPSALKAGVGGDMLEIEVQDGPDLTAEISSIRAVTETTRNGNVYSVRVANIEHSLQSVTVELWKLGLSATSIRVRRSSLDEVFLNLTGRSIRDSVGNWNGIIERAKIEGHNT